MQLGPAKESWEDEQPGEEGSVQLAAAESLSLQWQSLAAMMALAPEVGDDELCTMEL